MKINISQNKQFAMQIFNNLSSNKILLLLLIFIAFLLRIYTASHLEFYPDEYAELLASSGIISNGLPIMPSGTFWPEGGVFLYLIAPLIKLFGYHELVLRLPGVIFSIIGLYLIFKATKILFGETTAFIALVLCISDFDILIWGGTYLRPYIFCTFLIALAFYFCVKLKQTQSKKYLYYIAISSLFLILTQPISILYIFPFIFLLFNWYSNRNILVKYLTFSFIFLSIIIAIKCIGDIGAFLAYFKHIQTSISLKNIGYIIKNGNLFIYFISSPTRIIFLSIFILVMVLSLLQGLFSHSDYKHKLNIDVFFVGLIFLIPFLILVLVLYSVSYFIALLPFFYIAASYFLCYLMEKKDTNVAKNKNQNTIQLLKSPLFIFTIICLLWNIWSIKAEISFIKPWKGNLKYISNNLQKEDIILNSMGPTYIEITKDTSKMYFFVEFDAEMCVTLKNNKLVDRAMYRPWIRDTIELKKILMNNHRVWFYTSSIESRQKTYYKTTWPLILKNMTLVYKQGDYQVYLKSDK